MYQSSFYANTQWSEEYAEGFEIQRYWKRFAKQHDVYSKLRLSAKVLGSYWEPQEAQWRLEIDSNGQRSTERFDFVLQAIGRFNSWRLPDYPGMDKYKGHLVHSSNWDASFDPANKRIAVIGNGASGVQILPALRKISSHIDHYARSPTWVASAFIPFLKERQERPMYISQEERDAYQDENTYLHYRKKLEDGFWRTYEGQLSGSDASKALPEKLMGLMKKRLEGSDDPEMFERLVPDFPPHCRRLTPAPGYLESLTKDNVTLIQTSIGRFTEEGKPDSREQRATNTSEFEPHSRCFCLWENIG